MHVGWFIYEKENNTLYEEENNILYEVEGREQNTLRDGE